MNLLKMRPKLCLLLIGALLFSLAPVQAQDDIQVDPAKMRIDKLLNQIIQLQGDLQKAVPYIQEAIKRIESGNYPRTANFTEAVARGTVLPQLYFKWALAAFQRAGQDEASAAEAVGLFTQYIDKFPDGKDLHFAYMNRGELYQYQQDYQAAVQDFVRLLTPPLQGRADRAGIYRDALNYTVQIYYYQKDWKNGIPWFQRSIDVTSDPMKRALAAVALMQGFIEEERFDEIIPLIPTLVSNFPPRYEAGFTASLINGGDKLLERKRVVEASFLFFLALTKDQILEYNQARVEDLNERVSRLLNVDPESEEIPKLEAQIAEIQAKIDAVAEAEDWTAALKWRRADCYKRMERHHEAHWGFSRMIEEHPDEKEIESYYYAAFDEAFKARMLDRAIEVGERYLANNEFSFYRKEISIQLCQIFFQRQNADKFFPLAEEFLAQWPDTIYAPNVVYWIGSWRIKRGEFQIVWDEFGNLRQRHPELPIMKGLSYWQGLAGIFLNEFAASEKLFAFVIKNFPDPEDNAYLEDATFRQGVCNFALEDYGKAKPIFTGFVTDYPMHNLRGEAELFLGDIEAATRPPNVEKALEHYQLAIQHVRRVAGRHQFIEHAVFRSVELLSVNERYAEAQKILESYIENFAKVGDVPRAILELGTVKEALGRPQEMLRDYVGAIERFGDDPRRYGIDEIIAAYPEKYQEHLDIIEANLQFRDLLDSNEAFRTRYTSHDALDFIWDENRQRPLLDKKFKDKMLRDSDFRAQVRQDPEFRKNFFDKYVRIRESYPEKQPRDVLLDIYNEAMDTEQLTLALRTAMALNRLGSEKPDVNNIVFTRDELEQASPATLVWISSILKERDPETSISALRYLIENHPESDSNFDAYMGLGDVEDARNDYEAARAYYQQAADNFVNSPRLPEAFLRQGDMLLKANQPEQAAEIYDRVSKLKGYPQTYRAEASFKVGEAHRAMEELETALAYYKRVYIAYPRETEWSGPAYLAAANILAELNRFAESEEELERMIENKAILQEQPALYNKALQLLGN